MLGHGRARSRPVTRVSLSESAAGLGAAAAPAETPHQQVVRMFSNSQCESRASTARPAATFPTQLRAPFPSKTHQQVVLHVFKLAGRVQSEVQRAQRAAGAAGGVGS